MTNGPAIAAAHDAAETSSTAVSVGNGEARVATIASVIILSSETTKLRLLPFIEVAPL